MIGCLVSSAVNFIQVANVPCEDCCAYPSPENRLTVDTTGTTLPPDIPKTTYYVPFDTLTAELPYIRPLNSDLSFRLYKFKHELSWILIAMLLFGYLAYLLYRRAKRNYVAAKDKGDEPPYTLPIKITDDHEILFEDDFYLVINRMRGRQESERQLLNIPRTIKSTIKRGGLWDFKYTLRSKSTEYLILIDKNTEQNHQAHLYETIYQRLRKNEVYTERFFFDADPTLCWNKDFPGGIATERLAQYYPNARLIVFSNGYRFINPVTGETDAFLKAFEPWQNRALLTPAPAASWNYREAILAEFFVVMSANVQGLLEMVEHFDQLYEVSLHTWMYELGENDRPIDVREESLYEDLDQHFDHEMQRWIAACALYPELHWDLTIKLGNTLSNGYPLVSHQNLTQLAKIKWFRQGNIPDEIREKLLEHPKFSIADKEKVRGAIVEILEDNVPLNKNSYAYEEHQLHLAVNKLLLAQIGEDKHKWLEIYREQHDKGVREDSVSIKELDKQYQSLLAFLIPERFRDFFFEEGRLVLGLKNWVGNASVLATTLLLFLLPRLFVNACYDNPAYIAENAYCLADGIDSVKYLTNYLSYHLENESYGMFDSLSDAYDEPASILTNHFLRANPSIDTSSSNFKDQISQALFNNF